MLLTDIEAELFLKLHRALLFDVNRKLGIVPGIENTEAYSALPPAEQIKVHRALLEHRELIEQFVVENPAGLNADELDIVLSWRHLVSGRFFVFRFLKKHTVFLSEDDPSIAYSVAGLTDPIEVLVGPYLPVWVETTLLPFQGRIVYDGLMSSYNISFGSGLRRELNESYKEAKARQGIVTTLPPGAAPAKKPRRIAAKANKRKPSVSAKQQVQPVLETIVGMTDDFCRDYLNEEYAELCRKLAGKLSRKRPSPLLSGRPQVWAAGIVRTIGWMNYLDDKSTTPHMRLPEIDTAFGIGNSTGASKSKSIRDLLKMQPFDWEWTLPSRVDDNPLAWTLQVNGFLMDIRDCPREAQEVAFEKGLIPYIPADKVG